MDRRRLRRAVRGRAECTRQRRPLGRLQREGSRRRDGALPRHRRTIEYQAMICRNCGTEIADKAIVCYRCGTATTDPVRQAVKVRPRRSRILSLVILVVLVLLALYLGQAGRVAGAAHGRMYEALAIALAVAAALLLIQRIRRR